MLMIAGGILLAIAVVVIVAFLVALLAILLFGGGAARRKAEWAREFNKKHPPVPGEPWEPRFGSAYDPDDDSAGS